MRPFLILIVPLAALLAYGLWPRDEAARVRHLPVDAARWFTDGSVSDCLDLFAAEFSDGSEGRRLDRETIRAAFLSALGRRSAPRWAARVAIDDVTTVELDLETGTARLQFPVRLLRVKSGGSVDEDDPEWVVAFDTSLRRSDDGSWRFVHSTHETLAGRAPYR